MNNGIKRHLITQDMLGSRIINANVIDCGGYSLTEGLYALPQLGTHLRCKAWDQPKMQKQLLAVCVPNLLLRIFERKIIP